MRLLELAQPTNIHMRDLVSELENHFDLERVGGDARIYQVGDRYGIIFLLNNSLRGLGLIWSKGSTFVQSVCVWHSIDFNAAPTVIADIPSDATLETLMPPLVSFIKHPTIGLVESIISEERTVPVDEFIGMAQKFYGDRASKLSAAEIDELGRHYDVAVPPAIKGSHVLKTDPLHWDLTIDLNHADQTDPHFQQAVELAKLRNVQSMADENKVVLMGRKADGALFEIPGLSELSQKIERAMQKSLPKTEVGSTMEQQYTILDQKVELVAGGKSQFLKSMLITGMPSSGKTFRVMKKIKELGLEEGKNYIVKKGKITARSLYRVLIEQIDGLAIFDDCDSVVSDKNAVNMLKGALDTDPVRELSYDVKGLINTGAMPKEKRDKIVTAMSRILRGVATQDDLDAIEIYREQKKPEKHWSDMNDDEFAAFQAAKDYAFENNGALSPQVLAEAEAWVMNNLPNKIDFQGRIIFISNMTEAEWKEVGDGAIMTRVFHQNMYFPDAEMLDYIDTIKQHINTPRLSEADKQEVLDYIRELWEQGKITKSINFRLVQQAFDLFLMNDWRTLVANIG